MPHRLAVIASVLERHHLDLQAVVFRPHDPASGLYRLSRDEDGLQLDFMTAVDGISSFEGLRERAQRISFGPTSVLVADLADIIKSKKAAGRPRDLAVIDILEKTLHEASRELAKKSSRL
jgi:hypothetical protein